MLKKKLADHIAFELGPNWTIRNPNKQLPTKFKNLKELFRVAGSRALLCESGRTIDRVVRSLNEAGVQGEDESIKFNSSDLKIPATKLFREGQLTADLLRLMADIGDCQEDKVKAIEILNSVLPYAITTLTKLGEAGESLTDIFDEIRRDLKKEGKTLALFIEDVTSFNVLDKEIVNAVEPKEQEDLCRLIAVLGYD